MPRIRILHHDYADGKTHYEYYCPGCRLLHQMSSKPHQFNDDFDFPTFTSHILQLEPRRCHAYIKFGYIEYLTDSAHFLRDHIILLPELKP